MIAEIAVVLVGEAKIGRRILSVSAFVRRELQHAPKNDDVL
jgi:hypothetical protein